jgi:hypothetical protein
VLTLFLLKVLETTPYFCPSSSNLHEEGAVSIELKSFSSTIRA